MIYGIIISHVMTDRFLLINSRKDGFNVPSTFDLNKLTPRGTVKKIEKLVYERLKPLGFGKYGKILHRFVDGDISQVVFFQSSISSNSCFDRLWITLGIRVPECQLRKFVISEPLKEYYHFAECNLQSTLRGTSEEGSCFLLNKSKPEEIINNILRQLDEDVIPTFETLNSRDNIIKYRKDYPHFKFFHLMLLEEAMIWGRKGNLDEASRLFNLYYQKALAKYNDEFENGYQSFLYKGESVTYLNPKTKKSETVIATHDGYFTIFGAYRGHLNRLEELAKELGIDIL